MKINRRKKFHFNNTKILDLMEPIQWDEKYFELYQKTKYYGNLNRQIKKVSIREIVRQT